MQLPLSPAFARKLGISWRYALGFKQNRNAGREPLTLSGSCHGAITHLGIRRTYNLGNHLRQIGNAYRFAQLHGVGAIVLPADSWFDPGLVDGIRFTKAGDRNTTPTRQLIGDFFYPEGLGITYQDLERAQVIKKLRSLFRYTPYAVQAPGLVVHLRGGDALESNPHPRYSPPPLAFFLEVIQRAAQPSVTVVTQDSTHPYLPYLERHCRLNDISYHCQSSSLEHDFRTMMSATALCVSQGTLALAASWMSPLTKQVFAFDKDEHEIATTIELGQTLHHAWSDLVGQDWAGSEQQKARLLLVKASDLQWKVHGPTDRDTSGTEVPFKEATEDQ